MRYSLKNPKMVHHDDGRISHPDPMWAREEMFERLQVVASILYREDVEPIFDGEKEMIEELYLKYKSFSKEEWEGRRS